MHSGLEKMSVDKLIFRKHFPTDLKFFFYIKANKIPHTFAMADFEKIFVFFFYLITKVKKKNFFF